MNTTTNAAAMDSVKTERAIKRSENAERTLALCMNAWSDRAGSGAFVWSGFDAISDRTVAGAKTLARLGVATVTPTGDRLCGGKVTEFRVTLTAIALTLPMVVAGLSERAVAFAA